MAVPRSFQIERAAFGADFTFGCATAAYQIEGVGETRGRCIWDTFAATGTNVRNRDDGAVACDHVHKFAEDLDLLKGLGFSAYRFSFSWPRLFPGAGPSSDEGFDFYDRLIDAMLERGLAPYATLYHWDLPSELQDQGGWMNRDTAYRFAEYASAVAGTFGDRLESLATFNEPWCITYLSHMLGCHAPGYRDQRAAARAMHHVPLAHGLAIQALRAQGQKNLGIVLNMERATPADDSAEAAEAAHNWDSIYTKWFCESLFKGTYPADVVAAFGPDMPKNWQDDMALISEPLDWLGINYYTRSKWQKSGSGYFDLVASPAEGTASHPLTSIGWEQHAEGLTYFLQRTAADYTGDLPLYVTENGLAWNGLDDDVRTQYFNDHLNACHSALESGVPLKGYFAWSLLDNYEWAEGYEQRFGLIHVDYETQKRTLKDSAKAWQRFLTT